MGTKIFYRKERKELTENTFLTTDGTRWAGIVTGAKQEMMVGLIE